MVGIMQGEIRLMEYEFELDEEEEEVSKFVEERCVKKCCFFFLIYILMCNFMFLIFVLFYMKYQLFCNVWYCLNGILDLLL